MRKFINDDFTFKKPEDPSLDPKESKFLEWFLKELNEFLYPDEDIDELKESGRYYWVPLMRNNHTVRRAMQSNGFM